MSPTVRHPKTLIDVTPEEIDRELRELEDQARNANAETQIRIGREIEELRKAKEDLA